MSKWCNENLNSHPLKWDAFRDEFGELVEAVKNRDLENFKEEVHDSLYSFYCALNTSTGINLPMFGIKSIDKILKRFEVWKVIFAENGLVFDKKYLFNGSNYEKIAKVNKALDLARKDQIKEVVSIENVSEEVYNQMTNWGCF
jgi:hypothetical protein